VSFENERWQASCRPHLVISADSMTRKRHENAMSIVMKGEASPAGWRQAPPLLYTGVAGRSSVEKGRAWRSPWPPYVRASGACPRPAALHLLYLSPAESLLHISIR